MFSDPGWIAESFDHEHSSRIYVRLHSPIVKVDGTHRKQKEARLLRTQTLMNKGLLAPEVENADLL